LDDEKLYLSEQIYYLLIDNGRKLASLIALKIFGLNFFDYFQEKFF
jgi:hypothetical protein